MPRPRKPRNPRVVMGEHLATIKRYASWAANHMRTESVVRVPVTRTDVRPELHADNVNGIGSNQRRITVYGAPMIETTYSTYETRKRRPEEYPENDSQSMINMFTYANAMIVEAQRVADIAKRQYEALNPGMTLGYNTNPEA